jgi:hypothetical protein
MWCFYVKNYSWILNSWILIAWSNEDDFNNGNEYKSWLTEHGYIINESDCKIVHAPYT